MVHATPELCQVIGDLIDSAAIAAEATLAEVREVVVGNSIFVSDEGELLFPQDRTFLVIEIDELIDSLGSRASARELTNA